MSAKDETKKVFNINCSCCGAYMTVDAESGAVVECFDAQNPRKSASLSDAQQLLKEESERIHGKYQRIVEADKSREAEMDKKFKEFFQKTKDEPGQKPLRDIDLD